jgi:NAD(P)H-hydrate epimerase
MNRDGVPTEAHSAATIRAWDRQAIEEFGIPAVVLMENAGSAAARILRTLHLESPELYPEPFRIYCGPGNNGGDGFVVARYLDNFHLAVELFAHGTPNYPPGSESAVQLEIARRMHLPIRNLEAGASVAQDTGTSVDALFGTGLARPLRSPFSDLVAALNCSAGTTVALDLPSGLDADTGEIRGCVVQARDTVTFAAAKKGFSRGAGPASCGRVHVVDIGIPREVWER